MHIHSVDVTLGGICVHVVISLGTIPSSFGMLSALTGLLISYNQLTGNDCLLFGCVTRNATRLCSMFHCQVGWLTVMMLWFVINLDQVPSFLCNLTSLARFEFSSNNFTCYPSCLSSLCVLVSGTESKCDPFQNEALCGFIAATDLASRSGYDIKRCKGM